MARDVESVIGDTAGCHCVLQQQEMEYTFRKASIADVDRIMEIIEEAKQQMAREGKNQWTAAYPARDHIETDVNNGTAYVMLAAERIVAYGAVVFTGEPAYDDIEGKWLTEQPYVVLHRLAVAEETKGRGVGLLFLKEVEKLALSVDVHSFKVDTNYDNSRMLSLLEKQGFAFCGNVCYPQGSRMAYEKLL